MAKNPSPTQPPTPASGTVVPPVCGIVMPISAIDGVSEAHWADVRDIFTDAIDTAGFAANLVSDADDVGVIHKRIIQNLYENPLVVCDVSGKNPNVMFELGLRLAFDKPTIIVKDDKTAYSFDTSGIEHLEYPRDLRFGRIVDFKSKLSDKIRKTHERATTDANYTTFLKHFGDFKVARIERTEVTISEFMLDELKNLNAAVSALSSRAARSAGSSRLQISKREASRLNYCCKGASEEEVRRALSRLGKEGASLFNSARITKVKDHNHIVVYPDRGFPRDYVRDAIKDLLPVKARLKEEKRQE